MPYYKVKGKGRKYGSYKGRKYAKGNSRSGMSWSKAGGAALWAAKQVWKLKGLVNSEMLKSDVTYSESSTNAGVTDPLCEIAQGDTGITRTGNSIYVRSVNCRLLLTWNSAGDANQTVRIMVVEDMQQIAGTRPTMSNVLTSVTPTAHLNIQSVGRFKVLFNEVYELNVQTPRRHVEINIPLRHHVRYTGGNATDIQKGALYMFHCSTQATANYPTIVGESRLSYHDN